MLRISAFAIFLVCASSLGAGTIQLYDYGTLDTGTNYTANAYATGINASGQVVGYSETSSHSITHGFLLSSGVLKDLGTLGGITDNSYAQSITDAGTIVGYSNLSGSLTTHAFIYSGNVITDIDGSSGTTYGYGINSAGVVVGSQSPSFYGIPHGFVKSSGTFTNTGTFAGAGINASGRVVGYVLLSSGYQHATSYLNGTTTDLGVIAGNYSNGNAINASGQMVGQSDYDIYNNSHAFFYSGNTMTDLGSLGGNHSAAFGVNSYGQVVGDAYSNNPKYLYGVPKPSFIDHAFLYSNGHMYDLNDYISTGLGITLTQAVAINDSGVIAINGTIGNGSHHFFVMDTAGTFAVASPTPEPASFGLALIAGLLVVGLPRLKSLVYSRTDVREDVG